MSPSRSTALAAVLLLAGTPRLAAQAPTRTFTLPDGLRVVLREDQGRLLFRARLRLALRPGDLPPGKEGLADLALRMMDRGEAGQLGPAAFDRALDESGIRLTRTLSADALTWDLLSRSRDQDRALSLLANRVLRPVLDLAALEPERLACWRDQEASLASPEARLRAALGLDGPPPATEQSLGQLTFADLETFLRRVLRPDRALLVLEGDLGLEQAKALVLLSLGTWTGAPLPPDPPVPSAPAAPAAVRIPAPGEPLRIEAAVRPPADLDPALRELVLLLLRNDPRLAGLLAPEAPGGTLRFTLRAPGLDVDAALAILRDRLAALAPGGCTAADLDRARTAWAEARRVRLLHPEALLAGDLQEAEGLAARPGAVAAATPEALRAAMVRWLDPARIRWAVVGDPASPRP
jgi:predicted Zn-dependent peptidase